MHLLDRIRRFAAQHALWSAETRVVAAVSGGSDSVALFLILRELAALGDLRLAGFAHLHHHIRGAAADEDAAWCRALSVRAGVPAVIGDRDVPALSQRDGLSIEVAGRQARQQFFVEVLASLGADVVGVAHTRDDQAETVLLRLVRGAGPAGLSGIAPRRAHLVRPLLAISRDELRDHLRAIGESWRDDATNQDCAIPRNRIRHQVLPLLRTLNPQADAALARTADILRGDTELFDHMANEAALRLVRTVEAGRVTVDAGELARLPQALARRVALVALETVDPRRSYGLEEGDSVCAAAQLSSSAEQARRLHGIDVERLGACVVLVSRASGESGDPPMLRRGFDLRLTVPGSVRESRDGWTLSAEGPMQRERVEGLSADKVMVDASGLTAALIVRSRRPGDRLHPLGAPGRKKVQDVLVDRKVPRDSRDGVPIVTDELGRIVWVAGQVMAEPFRVTPLTTTVVTLTLRRR